MKQDTTVVHSGRDPQRFDGVVNVPAYRASTVTFPTVADLKRKHAIRFETTYYGRYGTPTTAALEEAVAALEGATHCAATSSGMGAVAGALLTFLKQGDHLLMVDTVYWPTRKFCDVFLKNFGVETTYYDPLIGAGIAALIRPNTKIVYCESPGSHTFQVQDIPAIAGEAHAKGALVLLDNTWASPLFFEPFSKGVDVSIQAATKYIVGHSDAMLGTISVRQRDWFLAIKDTLGSFGYATGSEEAFLGLRGLRTLSARLERHQRSALAVATWLQSQPEVERVLYPALPDDPGHALWTRDFTGASGLFGVLLKAGTEEQVAHMLDHMTLFAMGYSWGGYESLVIPTRGAIERTATQWTHQGPSLRLHIGLEDPADLIADLRAGLDRLGEKALDQ
ncbi:cystathionine beta-lyase [Rhodospirillum rubrum]|uniref:Cystathionine beta-lyase n=1 Tax=Rhodospirillum rubrum (strain ATCC 11170 / ATH 1.1.1 / DSM 467 / LMG 4362 / NCIMB 8255 / S1) TaxID=269796 RepID=Q2RTY2_RHORT|nr:cystathionine beta-lyase [Rhodospirillum rubrum]ABC22413.1 cystathionine beta-lyase [Rhodospirillum rubrum ATCC 11170]AEO48130.1 cystathionine beta-lyase [Rhodospirillum rubrum F11]MBK5953994.1 cystathionine beta-lyase [Rhodospirillum rubrum]QXG82049.1 cystathionine beta-lyase [Rhodospirillum rubrum]HAP99910.1 cystathionine beta-lyase [Rhodospirillum rubrum]